MKTQVPKAVSLALAVQAQATFFLGEIFFRLCGRRFSPTLPPGQHAAILVVRLDEIGDMVMTTPFLRALRDLHPDAPITLVVKRGIAPLFERCPYVTEVLTFDQRGRSLTRPFVLPLRALAFSARHLWRRRYALALLPRWDADYYYATFLAYFSGAPRRIGFSEKVIGRKSAVNRGYDRLLTEVRTDAPARSEIAHSLGLVAPAAEPLPDMRQELWIDPADRVRAAALLEEAGIGTDAPLIGIGPAGGHSVLKQWPPENFAELGRRLHAASGAAIAVIGGPGEEELGQAVAAQIGAGAAVSLAGRTTLRETAAVMERCQVYIGNDSGPTHMAAAMGIPVVAIFGSSCRHRFHPGGSTALVWRELPCSPCQVSGHEDRCHVCIFEAPRCLTEISVAEVEEAAMRQLDGFPLISPPGARK